MKLDDLKERVFELVERELIDPRGVDELLAGVPGGRDYFERIKAALSLADLLPIEDPPDRIDAKILASVDE